MGLCKKHLSELEESFNEMDMDLRNHLHEGSKNWFQYREDINVRNGQWSYNNKKEGFLFLRILYLIHKIFERYDKGKNFDWLKAEKKIRRVLSEHPRY